MTTNNLLNIKRKIQDLTAHRKKYEDGKEKEFCDDERIFCGWEKEQIISVLRAITMELKAIEEAINLKDNTEKQKENK